MAGSGSDHNKSTQCTIAFFDLFGSKLGANLEEVARIYESICHWKWARVELKSPRLQDLEFQTKGL